MSLFIPTMVRKFKRASAVLVSMVALLFGLSIAQTQTADTLQVLKKETALSKRKLAPLLTTTYGDFGLNSCTLSFAEKSHSVISPNLRKAPMSRTSKYTFPLKNLNVSSEWLDSYNSYVVLLSGPGDIFKIETNYNGRAPNATIPFVNENSAKRFEMALHSAIFECGGGEKAIKGTDIFSKQDSKNLTPDNNEQKFNLKVNVELVTTDVTVMGDNVPDLQAEDFVIYDNGVSQQISYFSHDQRPLAVAILLEPSTRPGTGSHRWIAALSCLRILKSDDQIALYSLEGNRLGNLTNDRLHIENLVNYIENEYLPGSDIFRTLSDAARYLKQNTLNRRVILLISNNDHTGPLDHAAMSAIELYNGQHWSELKNLERISKNIAVRSRIELLESATTLYDYIDMHDPDNSIGNRYFPISAQCSKTIKRITEETGGKELPFQGQVSFKDALEKDLNRLRTQYVLGFNPSNSGAQGSFHELTVKLANKDRCPTCRIMARRGYYAGISAPLSKPIKVQPGFNQSGSEIDNQLIQQSMLYAASSLYDLDEITFALKNAEKTADANGQTHLKVALSISPAKIRSEPKGAQSAYSLQAAFYYSDKKGNISGSSFYKIEGRPNIESNGTSTEIPFSAAIPFPNQILRIVIYDENSGRIGSKFVKRDGKSFTLESHPVPPLQIPTIQPLESIFQ